MSSYIDQNLMEGENIIYQARLSKIIFFVPVIAAALLILSSIFFFVQKFYGSGLISLIIGVIFVLLPYLNYISSEFGITNRRVLVKVGFIRRHSVEILLSKIEGIMVNQGILGRILDYGTIIISGTGGGKNEFKNISNPLELRKQVQQILIGMDKK